MGDCNPGFLHLMLLDHTVLHTIKTLMRLKYAVVRTSYKTYTCGFHCPDYSHSLGGGVGGWGAVSIFLEALVGEKGGMVGGGGGVGIK